MIFLNYQQIFLFQTKEKGKYVTNQPVSNLDPLFPTIPLILLHYQVDSPNFRTLKRDFLKY